MDRPGPSTVRQALSRIGSRSYSPRSQRKVRTGVRTIRWYLNGDMSTYNRYVSTYRAHIGESPPSTLVLRSKWNGRRAPPGPPPPPWTSLSSNRKADPHLLRPGKEARSIVSATVQVLMMRQWHPDLPDHIVLQQDCEFAFPAESSWAALGSAQMCCIYGSTLSFIFPLGPQREGVRLVFGPAHTAPVS